jgi:hypothetical protein
MSERLVACRFALAGALACAKRKQRDTARHFGTT